ncbi:hypothetical protein [Dokdonella sp.]|uniref:hypothetical protein n=1 Tax=Dokdonella sp. TaxID=2291710 RepID=UPI003C529F27
MNPTTRNRMLVSGATLVVIITVVAGLVVIGPPSLQRERKLDQRRIFDLSQLVRQVTNYWKSNKKLPMNIDALAELPGFRIPSDPKTSTSYEYTPTGELTFKVCAVFALDTSEAPHTAYFPGSEEWLHGVGHTCFDRNVDKVSDSE